MMRRMRSETGQSGNRSHLAPVNRSEPLPLAALLVACAVWLAAPRAVVAQVSYVARFTLEKPTCLQDEPIFCKFTIQNTGTQVFAFSYRTPSRAPNPELEAEPRFFVRDQQGQRLPDPAPKPCGGAKGSTVYGSVTLPPGQTHTERWLLNQWARFSSPGRYRVRAERRLPLLGLNASRQDFSGPPVAYALAINELSLEVLPSTQDQLQSAFQPYLRILEKPAGPTAEEALRVLATLPQPFALERLSALARAPAGQRGWDRQQALEGLARLGTGDAWEEILKIARGSEGGPATAPQAAKPAEDSLRAYAVLLLGEKGDAAFLPTLLEMLPAASETLRGEVLRTLGLFDDSRANQVLFEKLYSPVTTDRVNAILGLRNLGSRDVIPALIAMLSDPDAQVRQVGHFALQGLTGQKISLPQRASPAESRRVAEQWHAWWRKQGPSFVPAGRAPCQEW